MSKLDKRAISILVIAIFLMSMIPFMPAQAAVENIFVSGLTGVDESYTLGGTVVSWATDKSHSGAYSAKLSCASAGHAYVEFALASGIKLSELATITTDWNFWYFAVTGAEYGPLLELHFSSTTGDGHVDVTVDTAESIFTLNAWTEEVVDSNSHAIAYGDLDGTPGAIAYPAGGILSDIMTGWLTEAVGDWELTRVRVEIGWIGNARTVYIDDITIDDVFYDLEFFGGTVVVGDTLTVSGIGLTSGSEVQVYWDYATGPNAYLLNTTLGNPDGSFELEIDVPSAVVGVHYIWVTDVETGIPVKYDEPIFVLPKLSLSPSSGLEGDEITVKGYGFSDESDVTVTFTGGALDPIVLTNTVETDELGYFTYEFDVPTPDYETYLVTATDSESWAAFKEFIVGASISLTPNEGPTGSVVNVEGRGWTKDFEMSFKIGETTVRIVDEEDITVASGGTFSIDLVIPNMGSVDEYSITATEVYVGEDTGPDPKAPSSADFDITGIPEIVVSPTYGTPGATITVTGSNFTQISGTKVDIELWITGETSPEAYLVIAETESDGTFEDTFVSPAVTFKTYTVTAEDKYDIDADDAFKVGLIALIINPVYGESGTDISITGIGFLKFSSYNVTFGTKLYEDFSTVSEGEAISDTFYVPNVEPGTYDVTIIDEDENELTVQFAVTESTYVIADPAMAPIDYNVTFKGFNFADYVGLVDFVLYNSTEEWEMTVSTWDKTDSKHVDAVTDSDGNFTAWWKVPKDEDLVIGDYLINVTGPEKLFVQVPFSIVAARVSVEPRKAQFDRGDMIQFDINNDFKLPAAFIEIYSPGDILYWSTDIFDESFWMQVEGLYTVPYYRQTDDIGNPMELQSDAPMGPWLYRFYEDADTELMNGTFMVGPSTAAQVDEKLSELWASMEDLSTNIDSITDELAGDISDLSGDIEDVVADVQDMVDDITADLAEELAGVAEDTEAAVDELEGAIGDIASAQNELASNLEDSLQTSIDAKEAAEAAQDSAQGLTTLVYGAIAASLIAALAAVVSLMQISKKIA